MTPPLLDPMPAPQARAVAYALSVARHRHVAPLLEVYDDPHRAGPRVEADAGPPLCLVVGTGEGPRLTTWLDARRVISAGEAVTVLVPLLRALRHLQRRGVEAGGVGADDVVVDDVGAPVLVTPRGGTGAVEHAARALVRTVLGFVDDGVAGDVLESSSLDDLIEFVSDLGAPEPLETAMYLPTGPAVGHEGEAAGVDRTAPPGERGRPTWLALVPGWLRDGRLAEVVRRASQTPLRDVLRSVRPRYWSLTGIMAVSVVAAALVASRGSPPVDEAVFPASQEPVASMTGGHAPAGGLPAESPAESPAGAAGAGPDGGAADAIGGADPALAVAALLDARRSCLREPTERCFADVDQPGSPLSYDDATAVADLAGVSELVDPTTVVGVRHRLGDTALVDTRTADDEPASVLVVKTEAGWRLREISLDRG